MQKTKPLSFEPLPAELILESLPTPVLMINNDSTISYLNSAMEKFLNEKRDKLLGKPLLEALYKGQAFDRRSGYRDPALETLVTGREFSNRQVRIKTIYHTVPKSLQVSTYLIKDDKGRIKGASAVFEVNSINNHTAAAELVPPSKRLETIYAFAEAIGARDVYTMGHSEKVAEYARLIAERMELGDKLADLAYLSGIVHDVGKIGIPEYVLNKKHSLTAEEYKLIMDHSRMGANILSHISWLEDIVPIIEAHHERYDGNGYPRGLKGDEIPLLSRILAVADAFDAMTSDRSYRKAYSIEKAVAELDKNAGTQFDPEIVDIFIDLLKNYTRKR